MTHASNLEIEVKLRIPSTSDLEPRLHELGFRLTQPTTKETSTLWDRERELLNQGCALRLRRYGETSTLTWKGPKHEDPVLKIRPERETTLENPEAMEAILRALRYVPVLRMEKFRSMWKNDNLVACLDQTPFGCFLELEGDATAIQAMMARLGMNKDHVETRSYPTLFVEAGLG